MTGFEDCGNDCNVHLFLADCVFGNHELVHGGKKD